MLDRLARLGKWQLKCAFSSHRYNKVLDFAFCTRSSGCRIAEFGAAGLNPALTAPPKESVYERSPGCASSEAFLDRVPW